MRYFESAHFCFVLNDISLMIFGDDHNSFITFKVTQYLLSMCTGEV